MRYKNMDRKIDQWASIDSRSGVKYIWSIDFNRTSKIILRKIVFSTDDAKTTGYSYGGKNAPYGLPHSIHQN